MPSRKKRKIAVCDCETDPFKPYRIPKPFIWGYYDGEQFRTFDETAEFVAFLKEQHVICYAHNGGKFDWHFLLGEVEAYDEIMLINGRIAKMHLGCAECRDSYNIIPIPLGAYKKDEIDYSIMEEERRHKRENREKILSYLRGDCVYLYELVSRFISDYGMNLTQAGASMKQWQKMSPLPVPQSDRGFYDEFARYYYGGRVECFSSGIVDTNFSVFDINSAYPYAMLQKHPYSTNYSRVEGYEEGADFYKVRCVSTGVFPFRENGAANQGLSFPADGAVRTFTVSGWEMDVARDTVVFHGDVLESVTFVSHVDFGDYINHFWQLRQALTEAGDEAGRLFAKLFMNSLYGKFAANPANYKNYMVVPMDVIPGLDALGWRFSGEFGPWGLAESDLQKERQRYYNVATGASITGFVRAMLWRAIHSSKGVLYCDTDSIVCERAGSAVKLGAALGEWKHEGDFDRAGIGGKKLYILRGTPTVDGGREYKTASKGVRLTHSQLWAVARGETVNYVAQAPTFSPQRSLSKVLELPLKRRADKRNTSKFFTARNVRITAKG